MASDDRWAYLASLPLSSGIIALASGRHPSEVFRFRCSPPRHIDLPVVPLWECNDAIVTYRPTPSGPEFELADAEGSPSEVIARSEQGLLFWLFSYLIEDRDWHDPDKDEAELRSAAKAVGFRYFDEVDQFQRKFGASGNYATLLRERALSISG